MGFRRRHPKIKALIMGVDSFDPLLLIIAKFYAVVEHILNRKNMRHLRCLMSNLEYKYRDDGEILTSENVMRVGNA